MSSGLVAAKVERGYPMFDVPGTDLFGSTILATGTVVLRDDGQLLLVPTGPAELELGDHPSAVELHGHDLPPDGARVAVEGELTGRVLRATRWRPEPDSTSAWAIPDVAGADAATTEGVIARMPEGLPVISVGIITTGDGNRVVVLEVDHATAEIHGWIRQQPSGAVHLITFITDGHSPADLPARLPGSPNADR